ncbi:DNA translocase FtsK [Patescibacteria group bacterium]|nr:DNA translocase FtsK [Patescibacteria group bacterium]MBU1663665.1 DNA translocase FtsK [Patescibacteria group bacterium]MBU1934144.1 DNA translocase FtsK [Patescibacteria group bacterium]MBU2007575.1 DNA translocase FtsK [Patescibacteria group bacterium]MBU2233550.1 DNA translocase FtsK [Patescibacteria group bacterium]
MSRRRRRKLNPLNYIRLPRVDLDPDMKTGIFIILILAFGAISFLSLFGLAEGLGKYLEQGIIFLFGWGKWLFPLSMLWIGFLMYNRNKDWVRGANYLGLFIFLIFFSALLHILVGQDNWQSALKQGAGGGYVGYGLISIFTKIMGFGPSLIVVVCLILISLMLMFNASLESLIGKESWFAKIFYPINFIFNKIFNKSQEAEVEFDEPSFSEALEGETEEEADEELGDAGFYKHKIKTAADENDDSVKRTKTETIDSGWKQTHIQIDLPVDLLNAKIGKPTSGDIKNNMLIIQRTLENFSIPVEMGEVNVGPTVTQYTLKPAEGIKLTKITALSNDLALSLAAHPIRIEAPIPGKSLVGVEVPNQTKAIVGLREILASDMFQNKKTNIMIALGKDVSGKAWLDDLSKMPHLLVAGATYSGKSVCLNAIIVSLLYQNNPDDLRFIMVDPKRVELPVYNGIPHLLTPVITEVGKTINALKWCLNEMDRRFELLAKADKKNIGSYNEMGKDKMPYIVFIIDELADLMVAAGREVEAGIIRLAQMARAVGIHLVLATQRPSVDVITGLIKANMQARIAFSVASGVDSRTILDSLGAEKLLGRGDMLFTTAEIFKPRRLQGAFVSENEIRRIVNYIKDRSGESQYIEGITDHQKVKGIAGVGLNNGLEDSDELLEQAKELIINSGKASASYLQRRFSIGYARAARLLDLLEETGVISAGNGSKPRQVLITREQYDNMINQGISGVSLHKQEESEAPDEYLPEDEEDIKPEAEEIEEEFDGEDAELMEDPTKTAGTKMFGNKKQDEDEGKYFSR